MFAIKWYFLEGTKWVKYALIIAKSGITGRGTVDFCGSTYTVAGNTVLRIR